MLQTHMVVGLLCDANGFLQSQVGLLTEERGSSWRRRFSHTLSHTDTHTLLLSLSLSHSLVSEVTVQAGQVEGGVSQVAAVAVVSVTLGVAGRQDEAVEVVQQAVSRQEDVLDPQAVQVAQVVLWGWGEVSDEWSPPPPLPPPPLH